MINRKSHIQNIMNTSFKTSKLLGLGSLLLLALGALTIAQAAPAVRASTKVTASRQCGRTCADAKTVTLTTEIPRGRGAMRHVVIGTEERCESCTHATSVTLKPELPNGRGALVRTSTKPAYHVCSSSQNR